jgi:phage-related protein
LKRLGELARPISKFQALAFCLTSQPQCKSYRDKLVHVPLAIDALWRFHHIAAVASDEKPLIWVASSKKDLLAFPEEVIDVFGFALGLAQEGGKHPDAKPLKGFKGGGVLEVVDDFDGDTYRAVYTLKFEGVVFALHAFQKKSKKGDETPKSDLDKIETRLKLAEQIYADWQKERQNG